MARVTVVTTHIFMYLAIAQGANVITIHIQLWFSTLFMSRPITYWEFDHDFIRFSLSDLEFEYFVGKNNNSSTFSNFLSSFDSIYR